ncbi:hypothetical protein H6P81_009177 [Aristolochia fimbriata]|uniref:B box-type domain-containing protein n=1 Tax=Aristolochia fimbriata TaxID=158543 RepID=A0AAV7EK42_ARIFI|nr:hypothetical protein H6P81_009177 [Aristolochia fimbriata]
MPHTVRQRLRTKYGPRRASQKGMGRPGHRVSALRRGVSRMLRVLESLGFKIRGLESEESQQLRRLCLSRGDDRMLTRMCSSGATWEYRRRRDRDRARAQREEFEVDEVLWTEKAEGEVSMGCVRPRVCELCNGGASVYCISDTAFLCWDCDASVHGANFLVARHLRRILCNRCKRLEGGCFSGVPSSALGSPLCRSCASSDAACESDSDSSSSTCISSSGSFGADNSVSTASSKFGVRRFGPGRDRGPATAYVDAKGERLLEHWCRRLGLRGSCSFRTVALRALEACVRKFKVFPFRVCLAASLWFAADVCHPRRGSMLQLKRLEQCSGVPAKLIVLAESKLRSILRVKKIKQQQPQEEEKEGWAES